VSEKSQPGEQEANQPPYFDPTEAARSFSAGAFVLAGFSFAAIVLIVNLEASEPATVQYERPVGALVTAFLGCVVSAFLMAVLVGQTKSHAPAGTSQPKPSTDPPAGPDPPAPAPRASVSSRNRKFWLAFLASVSLSSACLMALWGVSDLIGAVFAESDDLLVGVKVVFVVAGLITVCFVSNTGVDLLRVVKAERRIPRALWAQPAAMFAGGVVALGIGVSETTPVYVVAGCELAALVCAVGVALWLATFGRPEDWDAKVAEAVTWLLAAFPTLFFTFLFFMLR
jgi:energy-converting hydrogenase Eha subunit A